jgi:formylglycine-generating enzyme required for sulfatase activity
VSKIRTVIQVFLASPSDVTDERVLVQNVVAELNRSVAPPLGVLLELVRWEEVVPGMGRPQQVILDQAQIEHTDVFIGVLWNRFGTPTGKADSGTEEEFNVAYGSWRDNRKPHIMFYFCQRGANFQHDEELRQRSQVLAFRRRLSQLGVLREYQSAMDFESALRQDLTKHLFTIQKTLEKADVKEGRNSGLSQKIEQKRISESCPAGMVLIRGGEFLCGRTRSKTHLDYDFYIDEIPVTNRDFLEFLNQTNFMSGHQDVSIPLILERFRAAAKSQPDHPIAFITWYEAEAYATWVGKRLPTSLEWERAARGRQGRVYPWGDDFASGLCNSKESGIGTTTPVRAYPRGRSEDGCFDMAGNVFEWTSEWARVPRFSSAPNSEKINRGASFNRPAEDLVCWFSESDPPDLRMKDVGFRCVWTPSSNHCVAPPVPGS